MPNLRASYEAEAMMPRFSPPTAMGLPRNRGSAVCSTEAKKASASRWTIERGNGMTLRHYNAQIQNPKPEIRNPKTASKRKSLKLANRACFFMKTGLAAPFGFRISFGDSAFGFLLHFLRLTR